MRTFLAMLLLLLSSTVAAAPMQARDSDGTTVMVWPESCTNAKVIAKLPAVNEEIVAAGLPPIEESAWSRAAVTVKGQMLGACWVQLGAVVLVLDDGDVPGQAYIVPTGEFAPATEV